MDEMQRPGSTLRQRALGKGVGTVAHAAIRFMNRTDRLRFVFGPASRGDTDAPVIYRHDDFERASEENLSTFEVETDSDGHHYAVRKEDLWKERV